MTRRDFIEALRVLQVTPQQKRKRIEEIFGWLKTIGLLRQTRHRAQRRVGWMFVFSLAVYNLVRIRNLTAPAA